MISLQEKPTAGSVIIDGHDMWKGPRKIRNRIKNNDFAILFQDLNLLSEFSVYDNLRLAREIQNKKHFPRGSDHRIKMVWTRCRSSR